MGTLTVRNLDESVKTKLRIRAAQHGWAMEEEVRRVLTQATLGVGQEAALGSRIHARFKALGGGGLDVAARSAPRPAPKF
ncbi:plasmid stabilization protein [Polaromonas sp.]|uniref:FitA-like ribbon-helix-helix domain-containing protein n=1 Tax=Polaromonas sp. TaxID=1869339 RepID=UPI0032649474